MRAPSPKALLANTMGFSLKRRFQEKILWAIAFSPETSVDTRKPTINDPIEASGRLEKENMVTFQYFATCGGNQATIYEYESRLGDKRRMSGKVQSLQSHTSSDSDEDFYAVTFAQRRIRLASSQDDLEKHQRTRQVLCVAGASAKIILIDIETGRLHATLIGCISYVSDLKAICCGTGEQKFNLLCSATRDQVRVWNLDTLANVCIFAGAPDGHVGDVLTVAWHPTGSRVVSGGGGEPDDDDTNSKARNRKHFQICVWNVLDSPRLREAIQASSCIPDFVDDRSQFNPHIERFAASVHDDVHSNEVDCVTWLGDLILSKSIFDEIILWQPIALDDSNDDGMSGATESSILPIKTFRYQGNDGFYFVRFAVSLETSSALLAVGNNSGQVYLWDIEDFENDGCLEILRASPVSSKKQSKLMRGLAFSPDGQLLVGCDAKGGVYVWDNNNIN